ncbi:MAG: glycosyltransferase family 9 protein, partial [Leptospiraceae bacterium]|nr:glycosyltransferase family 9 protein [Leptospiraceae bacterium]
MIIKLGAIGDVIRTTPLSRRLRDKYPDCQISWITHFPDVLDQRAADRVFRLDVAAQLYVQNTEFDMAINLDKELEAGALLQSVQARRKFGFILKQGAIYPVNAWAEHKYHTGLFDAVSRQNRKSYVQEIFEIIGEEFQGEEYLLPSLTQAVESEPDASRTFGDFPASMSESASDRNPERVTIGLNTGCGGRWPTRLWGDSNWLDLIAGLRANGRYHVCLLGGPDEDERNRNLAEQSGAVYPGIFPLRDFMRVMQTCDVVVTQVTMALHLAVGLRKRVVLLNNIFNKHEFELYGRGTILEPEPACECYYAGRCRVQRTCMHDIGVDRVLAA